MVSVFFFLCHFELSGGTIFTLKFLQSEASKIISIYVFKVSGEGAAHTSYVLYCISSVFLRTAHDAIQAEPLKPSL